VVGGPPASRTFFSPAVWKREDSTVTGPSRQPIKTYKDILPRTSPDDRAYVEIIDKVGAYTMTLNEGLETTYALFEAHQIHCSK
jgi:hypothetical protein